MAKRPRFDIRKATDGQYYWRLVAKNGEVLCTSETYPSKSHAERGVGDAIIAMLGAVPAML